MAPAGLSSLSAKLRAAGASVVGRLSVADAVVVEVPSTWQAPVGVATAVDPPMRSPATDNSQPGSRHGGQGPSNASTTRSTATA